MLLVVFLIRMLFIFVLDIFFFFEVDVMNLNSVVGFGDVGM